MYGFYVVSVYKSYGSEEIDNDSFLSAVGATSAFCGAIFRFAWGFIMEKTSFKIAYCGLLMVQTVLAVLINFVTAVPALYLIVVCASFGCEGGHFTLFSAVFAKLHGNV